MVKLFIEWHSAMPSFGLASETPVLMQNAGCLQGRPDIDITTDMEGLSIGLSSTQSKATLMHLKTWSSEHESCNIGCISSNPAPSFHNCHA